MAAVLASDPGKAVMQNSTIQVTVNHLLYIGTEEPVLPLKLLLINLLELLKMLLNA
jgi:hypothetical protein